MFLLCKNFEKTEKNILLLKHSFQSKLKQLEVVQKKKVVKLFV